MWADLHNHVIPGVDDGAGDPAEAVAAIRSLRAQGVDHVVATPHFDGSLTASAAADRRLDELDAAWDRLMDALGDDPDLHLERGAEVKLDVPAVDFSDPRLRLGGGRTVLVEFAFFSIPPRSAEVLGTIRSDGYRPLLAHPERYTGLEEGLSVVPTWLDAGAYLQVNAGSLLGRYGSAAMERSRRIISRGWAHCVASDYHARGVPDLTTARDLIEGWYGAEQARLLFEVNPERLLNGEAPLSVAPARPGRSSIRLLRQLLPWK